MLRVIGVARTPVQRYPGSLLPVKGKKDLHRRDKAAAEAGPLLSAELQEMGPAATK